MAINETDSWKYPWTLHPDYMGPGTPIQQYNKQREDLVTQPAAMQVPAGAPSGTVSIDGSVKSPRVDQEPSQQQVVPAPKNPAQGIGAASYGGLEDGAGFAPARQTIAGSVPQGLPPGVTQLRLDVPADGPKRLLGPGLGGAMTGAEMPSRVLTPTQGADWSGQRAWGNASGEGPVIRTIGNGLTREAELDLLHRGGPLAVLRANQEANMMPLQREALAATTDRTRAEANKIAQDPEFEGRRVGAIEQEARNRLALGQGELGIKAEDIGLRERLGLGQLGLEQQKVNILGSEAKMKIAGMELDQAKQREFIGLGQRLATATTREEADMAKAAMLAFLGVRDNKEWDVKVFKPEKITDVLGNTTMSKGLVVVTGADGKPNIIEVGGHEAPAQYKDGELRRDPNTGVIHKYNAKKNSWEPKNG